MKAYLVKSDKKIAPFNDSPQDCLVTDRRLGDIQREVLSGLNIELREVSDAKLVEDNEEHLIFTDSLFFTSEILTEFIAASRKLETSTVGALKPGFTTLRSVVNTQDVQIYPDRVEYGLNYFPSGSAKDPVVPVIIDADEYTENIPMPKHMFGTPEYTVPLTEKCLIQIDHWTNIWGANMCVLFSIGARLNKLSKIKLLGLVLKARSINQWKVLHHYNKIGKNCDIHPTAYIEGSTIGDNVNIGAGTVVRESVIGDDVFIGDSVSVELSVLGKGAHIMTGEIIAYSVLYPGTFSDSRILELVLCGRDSFVGASVLTDFRLDGKYITVIKEDTLIDTANTFLGVCTGHNVYVGAGCTIAPGRAVPNDTRISPDETKVITKFTEEDIPGHRRIDYQPGE